MHHISVQVRATAWVTDSTALKFDRHEHESRAQMERAREPTSPTDTSVKFDFSARSGQAVWNVRAFVSLILN